MRRAVSNQSSLRYPLSEVFGSYNNVRVVRTMARHGGELSVSEISRLSGVAVQNVRVIVTALVNLRLLREIGSGRSRLFRILEDHPITGAIKAVFEAEEQRFSAVLQAVRDAAAIDGKDILAVWLYGSVARGEDGPNSDVDIAVVTTPDNLDRVINGLRERLRMAENAQVFTASVVGIGTDDVLRLHGEKDGWWINVMKDAMPLAGPDPQTLATRMGRKATK